MLMTRLFVCVTVAVTRPSVGAETEKNMKIESNVSAAAFTQ